MTTVSSGQMLTVSSGQTSNGAIVLNDATLVAALRAKQTVRPVTEFAGSRK